MDTRKRIQKQFIKLLQEKPLHTITVKAICDTCHINRSTFYYYYSSIDDVLIKIENDWLDHLITLVDTTQPSDLYTLFLTLIEDIKINSTVYSAVFLNRQSQNFTAHFIDAYMKHYLKGHPHIVLSSETKWAFYYAASGSSEVIRRWVTDKEGKSSQEVAHILTQFYQSIIQS